MRRATCLTLGFATLALAATGMTEAAQAQNAPPQYLQWAGRPASVAMPTAVAAVQPTASPRRPNRVIPHGGHNALAEAPSPVAPPRTLTPANAWLRAPAPALAPQPTAPRPAVAQPAPPPAPRSTPDYLPEQGRGGQPVPAEVAMAAAQPIPVAAGADAVVDPMAPRRDAPIFRIQQPASAPASGSPSDAMVTAQAAPATEQGARYYSVHRQTGRTPDPVSMPAPSYVEGLAITTPVSLASQDLAEPQAGPTLIRDAQGRTRVQPAAPEGDYQ